MCAKATMEDFEALLKESFEIDTPEEGTVVKGKVIAIEAGQAIIDVGYKMEGRIDLKEFANPGEQPNINVGDTVEVYLDRVENARGEAQISREKARREEAWDRLEKAYAAELRVDGAIFGRVKGGFTVDLGGAVAFLPGSQVDVRPVRDAGPLMGMKQPFQILKMDRRRGNIVVSRRAILEESRAEQRAEVIGNLTEGQWSTAWSRTSPNTVRSLTWAVLTACCTSPTWPGAASTTRRKSLPLVRLSKCRSSRSTRKPTVSLGMKQLQSDPWDAVEKMYAIGTVHKGRVTNITDYGAFVELEAGVEGLVHVSEMSWTKKNVHPGKIVSTSQEVDVMVLEIDSAKRRVSLGLKQTQRNPWEVFAETHPVGSPDRRRSQEHHRIRSVRRPRQRHRRHGPPFGPVVGPARRRSDPELPQGRHGQAAVTEVDVEKERISLSDQGAGRRHLHRCR
jgi:small subunit ribosomal protein S1